MDGSWYNVLMTDCIFCKIVAGEIPSYKIYEDEKYLAFLDISQISNGHALVVPKKHYRYVWDIEDAGGFFSLVQKIAKHMQTVTGKESVMSVAIGEMVPHAHMHLVPDTEGNRNGIFKKWDETLRMRKLVPEEMEFIRKRFQLTE